jgi:uncharacterized protein (TIGR00255 family)
MTGHGQAQAESNGYRAAAEIRSVNSRYFKLNIRGLDGLGHLEPGVEALVRNSVQRGTVNVALKVAVPGDVCAYEINEAVLCAYCDKIHSISTRLSMDSPVALDALLQLPGVVVEATDEQTDEDALSTAVEEAMSAALTKLDRMRAKEGQAMARDFAENCDAIAEHIEEINSRAPVVISAYEERLTERINQLLKSHSTRIEPSDIAREVGIFAERSDISEEVVRLRSHLQQFRSIASSEGSSGKKLEFIIQEMFRETNTIGSKSNDAQISTHVIEMKTLVERMREMVQNVE